MSAPACIHRLSAVRRGVWFSFVVVALVLGRSVWEKCDPNFVPPENPDALTGNGLLVLAGTFVLAAAMFYWLSYLYVAVDDDGITTGVPGFGSKSLGWSRIRRIREVNGGLRLYGQLGDPVLNIASIVDNFGTIRDEIVRRCPGALEKLCVSSPGADPVPLQLPVRVRVGRLHLISEMIIGRLLMAALALVFVPLGIIVLIVVGLTGTLEFSVIGGSVVFVAIGLLVGYFAWQPHWHAFVIDRDRIELKSLGKNRVIHYAELQDVTLVTEQTIYHGVPLRADSVMYLIFPNGKDPIALKHFKFPNGVIHAHKFVKALFETSREEAAAGSGETK